MFQIPVILVLFVLAIIFWRKVYDLFRGRGHYDDLYLFNSKLAELVKLQLPLDQALQQIRWESFRPLSYRFSIINKAIERLTTKIQRGSSLGDALDSERKAFPNYYVDMVRIGESEGNLYNYLVTLNSYLKINKDYRLSSFQMSGYSLILILIIAVVVGFISQYVAPTFLGLLGGMDVSPPVVGFHFIKFVGNAIPIILVAGLITYVGYVILKKNKVIRNHIDRFTTMIPFLGKQARNFEYAIFCKVMSSILKDNMPIDRALILASNATSNFVYSEAIKDAANVVEPTLASALKRTGVFDDTFIFMASLGEKTENLPEVLAQMSDIYAQEYERSTARLFRITEVGVTAVLGIFVGMFTVGVFSTMIKLTVQMHDIIVY
ncbi:MAG: type II secretion system F family protein [Candidatus Eremiobacteraeota bacterium]|nr:type II secretion system F family protein [Candidatus Eremiobacteraeota bacterium]